jgi:glycosyltransferase involved in cell wall biosynthesis
LVDRGDEAALRDRLSRLLSDATLRRACGERARNAAVTRFSAERMQREYLDLYTRVLKRKAS